MNKYYGNDNFNLKNAYDDCKQIFESITDDESYQKADCGVVMYYSNEIMYALEKALEERTQGEWVIIDDVTCECPFCHFPHTYLLSPQKCGVNYCSNCGADMRGKE